MHTITEEKSKKEFIQLLNDINQILKNSKEDNTYTIYNGEFYSFNNQELIKTRIKLTNKTMKDTNGFFNGIELFKFFEVNKKYITDIELHDDYFIIKTSLPEVEFKTKPISDAQCEDIKLYKRFSKRVLNKVLEKEEIFDGMDDDLIQKIMKDKEVLVLNIGDVKFKISHRLFLGMKAKDSVFIKASLIDEKSDIYLITISITNKKYTMKHYCVIVNY